MSKSSALSINVLLIFEIQLINGASFQKLNSCDIQHYVDMQQ